MNVFRKHGRKQILVAEQDPQTRQVVDEVLTQAGHSVVLADNGEEAVRICMENHPDLVVLDADLPGKNGFTICETIRANRGTAHTPVIMLTALDDVSAMMRAFETGATDFITKPINWTLFTHRVRYALRVSTVDNQLREHQKRLTEAQRIAKMGYFELDPSTDRLACSDELFNMLGVIVTKNVDNLNAFTEFVHEEHRKLFRESIDKAFATGEATLMNFTIVRPDGDQRFVYGRAEVVKNHRGEADHLVCIVQDVTEKLQAEQKVAFLTNYDSLTKLANRSLYIDRLDQAIRQAKRFGQRIGVMFIDLDRFKHINDSLGREFGNQVLRDIADRMSRFTRECDTLARIGGDEFAIVLGQLGDARGAARATQSILNALRRPLKIDENDVFVTPSIGIALFPDDGETAEALITNAEIAMHEAKQSGRDQFKFFTENMNTAIKERLQLETRLRHALDNHEFQLWFQPQINLDTGQLWGAEALIRWSPPDNGIVGPDKFIPILEETGLIVPVGEWVLETACKQALLWQRAGYDIAVSVNLSAKQFADRELVDTVRHIIRKTGIAPHKVELELTESTLMADEATGLETLRNLKAIGIRLAVDDFGTGYSSLAYLKKLPVDLLKVDKSFVINMANDQDDQIIVQSTIDLAHNLGLHVVAEGIENELSLKLLKEMKCEIAQGYYISKPLDPAAFSAWLENSKSRVY